MQMVETLGFVAREGEASESLVRRYADLGLIECARDPWGRRIFPQGTAEKVRMLKRQRMNRNKPAA